MVSIVIPCYNVEKYVSRAVASVRNQTSADWELILVNDGSSDGTGDRLRELAAGDERITVLEQENGGVSRARNAGLDAARGELVCPLDADDWLEPDFLRRVSAEMERTGCAVCVTGSREEDEGGRGLRPYADFPAFPGPAVLDGGEVLYEKSLRRFYVHTGNAVYRRDLLESHAVRYPEGYRFGEDNHFINTCLFFAGRIALIPEPLMTCLARAGSATRSGAAASYLGAARLNRQFRDLVRRCGAGERILTACDIDYIQLLTASAKNVVDNLPFFAYAAAERQMADFGIREAPRQVRDQAVQALPRAKRLEWRWFCRRPLLFFFSVKAYRLLNK